MRLERMPCRLVSHRYLPVVERQFGMISLAGSIAAHSAHSAVDQNHLDGEHHPSTQAGLDRRQFLGGSWRRAGTATHTPAARSDFLPADAAPGIAVRVRAERLSETVQLIATLDGARIRSTDPRGLLVVAAEAAKADAVLLALNHMPHVLSAAMFATTEAVSA
jgi:nitrate reductase NapAB chaperone NapD